jgi:hypothetical protein
LEPPIETVGGASTSTDPADDPADDRVFGSGRSSKSFDRPVVNRLLLAGDSNLEVFSGFGCVDGFLAAEDRADRFERSTVEYRLPTDSVTPRTGSRSTGSADRFVSIEASSFSFFTGSARLGADRLFVVFVGEPPIGATSGSASKSSSSPAVARLSVFGSTFGAEAIFDDGVDTLSGVVDFELRSSPRLRVTNDSISSPSRDSS